MKRAALAAGLASLALMAPLVVRADGIGDAEDNGPTGASALRSLADATGHRSRVLSDAFKPAGGGVLMVIDPLDRFTETETAALAQWVQGGGTLVYAASVPDPRVEELLGIARDPDAADYDLRAVPGVPLMAGVTSVQVSAAAPFDPPTGSQVAFLRADPGRVVGIAGQLGRGRFYALASGLPLTNFDIANADNGLLAADLLAAAGPGAAVSFDQVHHSGGAGATQPLAWLATPWGIAIVLEVVVVYGLLLLGGRVFGPPVPLVPATDPSSAEFTSAVGAMLMRARARQATISRLLTVTRMALARQAGLRPGSDPAALEAAIRQRAPALGEALHRAGAAAPAVHDDRGLAAVAAELHQLARPPLQPAAGGKPQGRT